MTLQDWMQNFRGLHERAKNGQLEERDLERYHEAREELAQALVGAQKITLKPGELARQVLRVPKAMQVDIGVPGGRQRAMTLDISATGFSAMLGVGPPVGERHQVALKMPQGAPPIEGEAIVMGQKRQGGTHRVSYELKNLVPEESERLLFLVFDAALDALKK
jgi:PilZ domain